MSDERGLTQRFAAYRRDVSDDVRAPGVEAVHRTVLHRHRRRTVVAGALAVLALGAVVVRSAVGGTPETGPVGPTSPSPTGTASPPSSAPSTAPSSAPPSSSSPSSVASSSRPPSTPPAAEQVPARRSYPVVDGFEMHVVALPEVRLQPVGGVYRGIVYVDVYNSGRQPSNYNAVYLTEPAGVDWDSPNGYPTQGGCVGTDPPETWVCPSDPVPAAGGYRRLPFEVQVNIAPGSTTRTVDGFAVRVMGRDPDGKSVDATPGDNKVTVRLVLPPA